MPATRTQKTSKVNATDPTKGVPKVGKQSGNATATEKHAELGEVLKVVLERSSGSSGHEGQLRGWRYVDSQTDLGIFQCSHPLSASDAPRAE